MTAPLFTDRDPCGCETALGHVCCPPWISAENWPWPAESQTRNSVENGKMIRRNETAPAGNRGLTHDLIRQEGAEAQC